MGCDKALLPFRGGTLAQAIAATVARVAGSATLVGAAEMYQSLGFPAIADLYPGEGPLGGILTALADTTAEWNLVTACDMPGIAPGFLGRLFETARNGGADAVVPIGPSGRLEPLCAVYHRRSLWALEAAFARGVRKIAEGLEDLRTVLLPATEVSPFQNVNTPSEWLAYAPG